MKRIATLCSAALVGLLLAGCVTPELPAVDTSAAGWTIRIGQAVWQPRPQAPELAGELVMATNRTGDFVIQFAKPPIDLVLAQRSGALWQVEFPPEARRFGGRGGGTPRLLWLYLADALAGRALPPEFVLESGPEGRWRLVNPQTGESLEGYLSP